jgi:hypothetical protein
MRQVFIPKEEMSRCHKIFIHRYYSVERLAYSYQKKNLSVHIHPAFTSTTATTSSPSSSSSTTPPTPTPRILCLFCSRRCNHNMGTRICVQKQIGPQFSVFHRLESNRNNAERVFLLTTPYFLHFPLIRPHFLLP